MEYVHHIAVVDDDPDIRDTFEEYLTDRGYRVSALAGGKMLRELITSRDIPDLVLLDVTMPGEDGLSLARYLSAETTARIIMVTASGATIDRVVGLELGADDYIAKPVDLRELLARVKAVLRRAVGSNNGSPDLGPPSLAGAQVPFGTCLLDLDSQQLFDEDGHEIRISAMEYDLLRVFAERPNRVMSRDSLLELAHNGDWEPFDRSIDIRVSRLRRKIERDPGKPAILKTVRGAGYIFVNPEARA
jgi:two-component system phosphate regulon response regulator OmpR